MNNMSIHTYRYVCVCMCIHIYIYVSICVSLSVSISLYLSLPISISTCIAIYLYPIYLCIYLSIYICICILCLCLHLSIRMLHVYTCCERQHSKAGLRGAFGAEAEAWQLTAALSERGRRVLIFLQWPQKLAIKAFCVGLNNQLCFASV